MKKILSILLIASAAVVLSGCKSVTTGGVTTSVPDVAQMQTVAKSAAFLGSKTWIKGIPGVVPAHPEDVQTITLVRDALKTLVAAGNFNAADLTTALQALPIKQLQGESGSLIVGEAVILWDQYGRQLANLDKAQVTQTYLLPVAQSIEDGLTMALGQ